MLIQLPKLLYGFVDIELFHVPVEVEGLSVDALIGYRRKKIRSGWGCGFRVRAWRARCRGWGATGTRIIRSRFLLLVNARCTDFGEFPLLLGLLVLLPCAVELLLIMLLLLLLIAIGPIAFR